MSNVHLIPGNISDHLNTVASTVHVSSLDGNLEKMVNTVQGSQFIIMHANVRSIIPKIDELRILLSEIQCAIFIVTESWLDDSLDTRLIDIPGYSILRQDREHKGGGGILIYYLQNLNVKLVQIHKTEEVECLVVVVKVNSLRLGIITVYRPPSTSYSKLSVLEDLITDLYPQVDTVYILGDLNCDQLSPNAADTKYLKSILEAFDLTQLITEPTRITEDGESLLDLIITDRTELVECSGVGSPIGSSDHCLTYVSLNIKTTPSKSFGIIHYRNYNSFDEENFLQQAQGFNWKQIEFEENVDNKVSLLESSVTKLFDQHAPTQTAKIKNKLPYISSNTKLLMKLRDRAHRKFKRTRLQQHWDEYKELRNFTTTVIRQEKAAYFSYRVNGPKTLGIHGKHYVI